MPMKISEDKGQIFASVYFVRNMFGWRDPL